MISYIKYLFDFNFSYLLINLLAFFIFLVIILLRNFNNSLLLLDLHILNFKRCFSIKLITTECSIISEWLDNFIGIKIVQLTFSDISILKHSIQCDLWLNIINWIIQNCNNSLSFLYSSTELSLISDLLLFILLLAFSIFEIVNDLSFIKWDYLLLLDLDYQPFVTIEHPSIPSALHYTSISK